MADVYIIKADQEQGIAEYGTRNIKQFDMRAFYGNHLIASLYQDENENWHWTERLHNKGSVEDVVTTYLDDKTIAGVIEEFAVIVQDWLEDEISYLISIKNGIDKVKVEVK